MGTAIPFSGLWMQKHISATSFLVFVNFNKFGTIFVEAFLIGLEAPPSVAFVRGIHSSHFGLSHIGSSHFLLKRFIVHA